MKETPRRRITVMSSLYEISVQISAGKRVVEREELLLRHPPPLSTTGF
jgi:hypothetical protein